MKNPKLAAELVKTVVNAVSVPVTVKMRAGWDESSKNAVELSKMCEHEGAAAITVHGRTRAQMYAPPVDLDIIKAVKNAVKIPVIANGDVISPADVKRMYKQTGCDHVSIGRGACGRPWIFSHINVFMKDGTILEEPSVEERMEILKKHIKLMLLYKGEHIAFREARKHAAWYIKGIKGAAAFRRDCAGISSLVDLENLCERVVDGM